MAEGLRKHYHQYYLYGLKKYYDERKHCLIKKATFRCMICGKEYYEVYEMNPDPPGYRGNKALNKARSRLNDK